jgi:uncharacterized iron-regulated membrane protein
MNLNIWNRKLHRWGAVAIALPVLLVIVTGLLLQVKKHWTWVQPPEQRGESRVPTVTLDELFEAARSVPQAGITEWSDIERFDVRPSKGITKIIAHNRWELQVDNATAAVLQVAYRRSDLIESLHDGSWFHDVAKMWIFLPSGFILLGLWVTGIYLFILPYTVRARKRKNLAEHRSRAAAPAAAEERPAPARRG